MNWSVISLNVQTAFLNNVILESDEQHSLKNTEVDQQLVDTVNVSTRDETEKEHSPIINKKLKPSGLVLILPMVLSPT